MEEHALVRLVRPRVIDRGTDSNEPVRIEDALERRLARRGAESVYVVGPPGSGKRTALEYVHLYFAQRPEVTVGHPAHDERTDPERSVRVLVSDGASSEARRQLELVPWTRDEWIEYLLARHGTACARVMARLEAPEAALELKGRALLWAAILDELARDASLPDAFAALRAAVRARFSCPRAHASAAAACWSALSQPSEIDALSPAFRELARNEPEAAPFLAQSCVHVLLAAQCMADALGGALTCPLPQRITDSLLRAAGPLLRAQPRSRARLEGILGGKEAVESTAPVQRAFGSAASLLHLHGPTALAELARALAERGQHLPRLTGAALEGLEAPGAPLHAAKLDEAHLAHAHLDGADLTAARLNRTDLRGASLRGARLTGASARMAELGGADLRAACLDGALLHAARLSGARLEAASLRRTQCDGSDLRGALLDRADLGEANLRGALLAEASLVETNLEGAILDGVDLRTARLETTRLARASLAGCNGEGLTLAAPDLSAADLRRALLTGSRFTHAGLHAARLEGAGLAQIEWEDADLREADLSHASFHLGSSRSGLVPSAPASWGTRTGFYSEELRDQSYRSPEELRKANLRRADLRGAKILDTDFYLVDLRGARCTPEQERHLRACGAIL